MKNSWPLERAAITGEASPPVTVPPEIAIRDEFRSDLELMARVARDETRAREQLAARLCERVYRIERGLLGSAHDADDATQDALLEILRAAGSYRGEAPIERWADRIAVRTGLRFRRRTRRHRNVPDLDPDALPQLVVVEAAQEVLPRPVLAYLDALPERERKVLFLRHGLGLSAQEIAEMTQTALSTTKYRISAALTRVRKAIRRDVRFGWKGQDDSCAEE